MFRTKLVGFLARVQYPHLRYKWINNFIYKEERYSTYMFTEKIFDNGIVKHIKRYNTRNRLIPWRYPFRLFFHTWSNFLQIIKNILSK